MSVVSSVLLQVDSSEPSFDDHGDRPGLQKLNGWINDHYGTDDRSLVELTGYMPRGKYPQTYVFGGGYNYFPENDFADLVMSMEWDCPENVVLVINPEEGPTRVWRPEKR